MASEVTNRSDALASLLQDDFESHLEESMADPAYRAAFEDAHAIHRLLASLVGMRKVRGLRQKQVAERMGVKQPFVSEFERSTGDPRISTLQRYARAVEGRLDVRVVVPSHCDWVSARSGSYQKVYPTPSEAEASLGTHLPKYWAPRESAQYSVA